MKNLFTCLHPRIITNPYTHERQSVPCGRCDACCNKKASQWVVRLEEERKIHAYTVFFTLDYNERYVPRMYKVKDGLVQHNLSRVKTTIGRSDGTPIVGFKEKDDSGYFIPWSELKYSDWSYKDRDYLKSRRNFPVVSVQDVQKFVKRLRQYFYNETSSTFRYYIASEYGPTTFRPHYHGVLFFDSPSAAAKIGEMLRASWWLNDMPIQFEFVASSATSYVASYVNMFAHLPAIYKCKGIRPFALCSRRPALGSSSFSEEKVRQLVQSSAPSVRVHSASDNQLIDVPLPSYLKNRLWPRFSRASCLSLADRVNLLRFVARFGRKPVPSIIEQLSKNWQKVPFYVSQYFEEISNRPFSETAVTNFLYIAKRQLRICKEFGLTIESYVQKNQDFYDNLSRFALREQLLYEQKISEVNPQMFIHVDNRLVQDAKSYYQKYGEFTDEIQREINNLDNPDYFQLIDLINFEEVPDYKLLEESSHVKFLKTSKSKFNNDYLSKLRDVKLKNVLETWHNSHYPNQ